MVLVCVLARIAIEEIFWEEFLVFSTSLDLR